jgi:hypothetical protein
MAKFTTIADAINHVAEVTNLTTEGAVWVYENSDCPRWDEEKFEKYDFLADPKVAAIPAEYVL